MRTTVAGLQGSVGGPGMPQSATPGIGGGFSKARTRANSSGGSSEMAC